MDLGQKLTEVWQTVKAGRRGLDEGMSGLAATVPDSGLFLIGAGAQAIGIDVDRKKGPLSGKWVETRMIEHSREQAGYRLEDETPEMKKIREGTAVATEGVGVIGTLAVSIWPRLAAALPKLTSLGARGATTIGTAAPLVKGVEEGMEKSAAKIAQTSPPGAATP